MTKSETQVLGLLVLCVVFVGVLVAGAQAFFEAVGVVIPIVLVVLAIGGYFAFKVYAKAERRTLIIGRYGEDVGEKILRGKFWQGMSTDQLVDSIGKPVAVDKKVLKTKTRETWQYSLQGGKRVALRIQVENGEVVGWEPKR